MLIFRDRFMDGKITPFLIMGSKFLVNYAKRPRKPFYFYKRILNFVLSICYAKALKTMTFAVNASLSFIHVICCAKTAKITRFFFDIF